MPDGPGEEDNQREGLARVKDWIEHLFANPEMLEMGHYQRAEDANLGLGWLYYGLARILRPKRAVVIGSWRGFAPMVIAKALADNAEGGEVVFVDPSLVDDFWADPEAVQRHFADHGIDNIRHHRMTTEAFAETPDFAALGPVGYLFVDGFHDAKHARLDHETFRPKLTVDAITLFHDSVREFVTEIYGPEKAYTHDVYAYMDALRADPSLQVLDLPFACGISLVRSTADPDNPAFFPFIRRTDGTTNMVGHRPSVD